MKFNMCTVALAAMAVGVSARPSTEKANHKGAVIREAGKGSVGQLFRRASPWGGSSWPSILESKDTDEDEEDDDEDDDEDSDDSSDDSEDSSETSAAVGDFNYPAATKTSVSYATATGSGSGSQTTGSGAQTTGSGSGSGSSGGSLPASSGTSALSAVQTIAAGESFDGGMVMFDRGVSCSGQSEGGESDAVFRIENGGSLSNVIIGPNQIEGVHCMGSCTLTNVWWSAVCEDAFTIKEQAAGETSTISGGGAYGAADKVRIHSQGSLPNINMFDYIIN